MIGWRFDSFKDRGEGETDFERLLELFKEILTYTSGNVSEALSWLTELDREHKLTDQNYTISDFIKDLIDKGLISNKDKNKDGFIPTSKMEIALRKKALEDIFDQIKKSKKGNHNAKITGRGDEITSELKSFEFGDKLDNLSITETLKNAHINHGIDDFYLTNEDLAIHETYYQSQTSTVLMIDISHSMILYGEDRITPAKKVAMALSELIITRYPKDTLDIIVFGNDAWQIQIKDLPYLQVGPYHTNTVAGLELAMEILRKRKNINKQIMMITDGKPTCIKKGKKYIQNSFGLDRNIVNRTLALAVKCKKLHIPVTTFMIARDPYLVQFVDAFTQANNGKAFYSSLDGLGEFLFMDYNNSKRKNKNK
jgi:uncharacterized protein with von Willebrand factor type A (vWA) domain